ncbi:MAG: hypothetical protein IKB01_09305 [Lachnospiraceae bacterium]|nr:hypothetical protein [Lachnospiraceae bacterium]MBR3684077.1 hypothetical protein [Lachnospiraceae bacterium]
MSFLTALFRRKKKEQTVPEESSYEVDEILQSLNEVKEKDFLEEEESRDKYVRSLVEKMRDASQNLDELSAEYNLVTGYLTDMEEIEALPESERKLIDEYAGKIARLDRERDVFQGKAAYLTEEEYRRIERMQSEVTEGIAKLKEAEKYQKVVKRDLKKLDGERRAYDYRKNEVLTGMQNMRGVTKICVISLIICFIMLAVLQFAFAMEVKIGYLILVGITAIYLTFLFVRQTDANKELERIEVSTNKLILLQNRVKIRFVNNVNLLDYLYLKYQVSSAANLEDIWNRYQKERAEREHYMKTIADLDYYQKELVNTLKRYRLRDPYIWSHQAEALVDHKEMVEIRHGLIVRRQNLRKQMDYNRENAVTAQSELKALIESHPIYAQGILSIVSEYEKALK